MAQPLLPARIQPYAKAVVGFITPVLASLAATADDGWTTGEWLTALTAGLATFGAVFATPNQDPKAEHQEESAQPPEVEADEPVGIGVPVAASKPHPRHLADD